MTVNLIYGLSFGSDDADFVRVAYSTWSTFCLCVCVRVWEKIWSCCCTQCTISHTHRRKSCAIVIIIRLVSFSYLFFILYSCDHSVEATPEAQLPTAEIVMAPQVIESSSTTSRSTRAYNSPMPRIYFAELNALFNRLVSNIIGQRTTVSVTQYEVTTVIHTITQKKYD